MSTATAWLDNAEDCLGRDDYRQSLKALDLAVWSLRDAGYAEREDVARLEQLLEVVARRASRRRAKKARQLTQEIAQAEFRRLLLYRTKRPTASSPPEWAWEDVGLVLLIGAFAGALVGALVGDDGSAFGALDSNLGFLIGIPVGMFITLCLWAWWTVART
jgi:hypothetical protein